MFQTTNQIVMLNLMHLIPNIMNPIFGFAAHYLAVKTFSWI